MFNTPARPFDILTVFPELAAFAKSATRLHPRRGVPQAEASSVAGQMLWPAEEPWPTCQLPHLVEVIRERTAEDLDESRRADEHRAQLLAQYGEVLEQIADPERASQMAIAQQRMTEAKNRRSQRTTLRTWEPEAPTEPVPMVPVVQLNAADIPEVRFPDGTDLLQILWCPYQHPDVPGMHEHYSGPAPKVIWRAADSLTKAIAGASSATSANGFVLEQCVVHPEQITEYPDLEDLPEPLQSRVYSWIDSLDEESDYGYSNDLSVAPGLKAGGWPYWPHGPRPVQCACGSEMQLLLTLPNGERGAQSWTPLREQDHAAEQDYDAEFHDPTGFDGVRDELLIFICRQDSHHEVWIAIE
ncbi:hypothetical protein [Nocardia sp. NBC_01327]|uniref:hypothetical protein n=1 Tax=Nocardia sp. NBC_01327 TaxID=2903593 RepID=UPI002E0FA464|nr:hypothetical protein OG326_42105 [Nocardia sp. NBC_01327]